jgi:hypothetical protein
MYSWLVEAQLAPTQLAVAAARSARAIEARAEFGESVVRGG